MRKVFVLFLCLVGEVASAQQVAPLEAYGALPQMDLLTLSPSGKFAASRVINEDQDMILVLDLARNEYTTGVGANDINPRWLRFLTDDRLVIGAGQTVSVNWGRNPFDYTQAMLFDTESGSLTTLLKGTDRLYPYQRGLGRIIGVNLAERKLYMPAYVEQQSFAPSKGIFAASLDSRRANLHVEGSEHTRDWIIDEFGVPLVREDFNDIKHVQQVWAVKKSGRTDRLLRESATDIPLRGIEGITPDKKSVVLNLVDAETNTSSLFLMSLADGSVSGPILDGGGLEVGRVIADANRVVHGVEFQGFKPTYAFLDSVVHERVQAIQAMIPNVSARLVGWDKDFQNLVFETGGGWSSGHYLLFEPGKAQPRMLGQARPDIAAEQVAPVTITRYTARDGLEIPALITAQEAVLKSRPAPTIVLPHGGPEAHDTYGFDWLAQFFASRGYVVLQPQFRGSDGFGQALEDAGDGEWGAGMQFDIDDGTKFLIDQGIADPEHICIVGASYGGYAALWAGAFSPKLYRCVAAIAAVTDIPRKTRRKKSEYGRGHWVLDYWEDLYGADASDKELLRQISPAYHAELFEAPVLLVHGRRDTVVDAEQSEVMYKALRKAGKDVDYVELEGEDHWMSQAETRIEMLRAVAEFIEGHL